MPDGATRPREHGLGVASRWWRWTHSWGVRVVLLAIRRDSRCRGSDRAEAAALISAATLFLLAIPLAVVVGMAALHSSLATAHRESMQRHQVVATVVSRSSSGSPSPWGVASEVTVVWQGPNDRSIRDVVPVAGSPEVGSHLTVWTTVDGQRVSAPITRSEAVGYGVVVGLAFAAGLSSITYLLLVGIRRLLLRRRVRAWDAEWIEIDSHPQF